MIDIRDDVGDGADRQRVNRRDLPGDDFFAGRAAFACFIFEMVAGDLDLLNSPQIRRSLVFIAEAVAIRIPAVPERRTTRKQYFPGAGRVIVAEKKPV